MESKYYANLVESSGAVVRKELKFTNNAICSFEREFGTSLIDLVTRMANPKSATVTMSYDLIRCMVWAGLLWRNVQLTVEQVGEQMSPRIQDISKNGEQCIAAVMEALGVGQAKDTEEAIDANFTSDTSVDVSEGEQTG